MTLSDPSWHPRARNAFQELSAEEQDAVMEALSRWWQKPRDQWPTDRLLPYRTSIGNYLFHIDDSLGVLLQWQAGRSAEIVAILRQQVEVVPTEKETFPVFRVPNVLLLITVLAWIGGLTFLFLGLAGIGGLPQGGELKSYSSVEQFTVSIGGLAMLVGCFVLVHTYRWA